MNDKSLIDLMVEETFSHESYPTQIEMFAPCSIDLEAKYQADKKCFSINLKELGLEIPMNWGLFKNRISNHFSLNKHDDLDFFIPIVESVLGTNIDQIQFTLVYPEEDYLSGHKAA